MDSEQERAPDELAEPQATLVGAALRRERPSVPDDDSAGAGASSEPPAPRASGAKDRVVAHLREHGADLANLASIGALGLVVFVVLLHPIGIGGDAIRKWHFVRQWFYANDFSSAQWDHHMARLGVNGIAYLVQLTFGRDARAYYVAPLAAGVLQVLLAYACGKRLGMRFSAVLGALFLILFPPMHAAASQLLPEVFSGAYAIAAMYLFLRYMEDSPRRIAFLTAASLAMFADYLAKETSVFFLPGFVLAILFVAPRGRARDLGIFLGVFALGVAGETAFYRFFTSYAHRFAVVVETHVADATAPDTDFLGLFARFEEATPAWRFVFYAFLPMSVTLLAFVRNVKVNVIVLVTASYLFFLTFLVRSIRPLHVWQAFQSRYLDPTAPFVMLLVGIFVATVLGELWRLYAPGRWNTRLLGLSRRSGSLAVLAGSLVVAFSFYRVNRHTFSEHPLVKLPQMASIVNDALARNLPVVAVRDPDGMWAAYSTILDDRLLAHGGYLPSYPEAKRRAEGKTFVAHDPNAYRGDVLRRLFRRHCYTEVVGKAGQFYVRGGKLPKACDAELSPSAARQGTEQQP